MAHIPAGQSTATKQPGHQRTKKENPDSTINARVSMTPCLTRPATRPAHPAAQTQTADKHRLLLPPPLEASSQYLVALWGDAWGQRRRAVSACKNGRGQREEGTGDWGEGQWQGERYMDP